MTELKAPFPYFGGKSAVADLVWVRLGDVQNYIEPFAGSVAVLLRRPHPPRMETLNDLDCYVANFWRATQHDPEAVTEHADWPVNEADLHARHRWLVLSEEAAEFRQRMRTNPDYHDARIAGWWCWGLCCWIGSGWCQEPDAEDTKGDLTQKLPCIGTGGHGDGTRGVHATHGPSNTHRPQLADAYSLGRGGHSGPCEKRPALRGKAAGEEGPYYGMGVHAGNPATLGTCAQRRDWLLAWFSRLRDRLRTVRVCCGDWSRVCSSDSVTVRLGTTGVFLDPPYGAAAKRAKALYSTDSLTVADQVREWCLKWGPHPLMRIALCGYAGEHEELEAAGWSVAPWKAHGGYGNRSEQGKANAAKERIWFSPFTLQAPQKTLFD